MRTSGWMKRQPWFWPIKLFLKRLSGRELWLRTDVELETSASGGWRYLADKLNASSVVYSLGVGDSKVDLLKMDVEGAEYDILAALEPGACLPRQLLVEYHHRYPGIGKARTASCWRITRAAQRKRR